jgi:hypothetical protein
MPIWRIYVFVLVVIAMGVSFVYLRLNNPSIPVEQPAEVVIERTVITEAEIVERTNPAFYRGVKNGDVVLRYHNRLELYRPDENRVIQSVPLNN